MALLGSGTVQLIRDTEQCEIQVSQVTPSSVASMFDVFHRCYYPTGLLCGIFVDKYPLCNKELFQIVGVRSWLVSQARPTSASLTSLGGGGGGGGGGVVVLHIGVVVRHQCARSHPREEYNYYITCYLGNITTQERYVQHSYMLPRWFYHCVFNLGFYYVKFMT